jgi:hypothetical protein
LAWIAPVLHVGADFVEPSAAARGDVVLLAGSLKLDTRWVLECLLSA